MQSISPNDYCVAKFGGTSLATHAAMMRCAKVVAEHQNVRVVVVSAPAGITNLLIKLSQCSKENIEPKIILDEIKAIVQAILSSLSSNSLTLPLRHEVVHMLKNLEELAALQYTQNNRSLLDELISHGERISARLFTCVLSEQGLPAEYIDARTLIKTNDTFGKAEVLIEETAKQVNELLVPKCSTHVLVTEGFIGSTLENITTTLGRGGSDYSAAILAEAMRASAVQIWTDVSGIYTVDPRVVPYAKPIEKMCFTEAAELAQFGAKVLHPATLWPAIRQNIPVFVGSSINPDEQGTWIRATYDDEIDVPLLRAIALRKNQSLLTINSLEMLQTHGFLAKIFSILAQHKLSVDLVTTSEVSVALTLNHSERGANDLLTPEILAELQAIGNVSLTVNKNLCLIALVGNRLHVTPGISGRVFKRLSGYNIRLICHGASPHNLCFLVNEIDAHAIIQTIHSEFFEKNQ